jgi:hypothetical protein
MARDPKPKRLQNGRNLVQDSSSQTHWDVLGAFLHMRSFEMIREIGRRPFIIYDPMGAGRELFHITCHSWHSMGGIRNDILENCQLSLADSVYTVLNVSFVKRNGKVFVTVQLFENNLLMVLSKH